MAMSRQDIQDQFDLWFPHGAVFQMGSSDDAISFVSPWVWVQGGSFTAPVIQVMGGPVEGLSYEMTVASWEITQKDPLVLSFTMEPPASEPYQLGARVAESVWSTSEWEAERQEAMDWASATMVANGVS